MTIILYILLTALLATVLIRLIVKEIKQHITKETDRIINLLNRTNDNIISTNSTANSKLFGSPAL